MDDDETRDQRVAEFFGFLQGHGVGFVALVKRAEGTSAFFRHYLSANALIRAEIEARELSEDEFAFAIQCMRWFHRYEVIQSIYLTEAPIRALVGLWEKRG